MAEKSGKCERRGASLHICCNKQQLITIMTIVADSLLLSLDCYEVDEGESVFVDSERMTNVRDGSCTV